VTFKRQDVWNLGDGWSDPLVWYAKGVRKLRERPLADPTSWRFLAAMHGFDPEVWKKYGYYDPAEQMPSNGPQPLLESVPTPELVLFTLAPGLSRLVRGNRARRHRG